MLGVCHILRFEADGHDTCPRRDKCFDRRKSESRRPANDDDPLAGERHRRDAGVHGFTFSR